MAHVSHKLKNSFEGALAGGGDPAYPLTYRELPRRNQRFPRGNTGQWQRGRLDMRNRLGFMSHFICADCHVLGISAITLDIRARENGFARLKCGYFRSDRFNHARNIPAKGERKSMGNHLLQIALPDLPVDGINRARSKATSKRTAPSLTRTPSSPKRVKTSSLTMPVMPGCWAPACLGVLE